MFSIGFYELIVILVLVLLIVPVKDLPKIAKSIAKFTNKIKKLYGKIQSDFDKISTSIIEEDNFKTWEDRIEEKRAEYNVNINTINNLIDEELKSNTSKYKYEKK